jgi:hypothetical protein
MTRPLHKNRTLWSLAVFELALYADSHLNLLQPLLPPGVYAIAAFVIPPIAIVLRLALGARAARRALKDQLLKGPV